MQFSVVSYSELERTKRIDAEFFWPEFLVLNALLLQKQTQALTNLCDVSDGNHMSVASHFQHHGDVPYYRGKDINKDFFLENSNPIYIPENIYHLPYMKRSWFQEDDVLLSIVGTVGSLSIVTDKIEKSTGSCKIAILRTKGIDGKYIASFLKSKYGQFQIKRHTRGAVQQGLLLEDMDQIQLYTPTEAFETEISVAIKKSILSNRLSKETYKQAQDLLLAELGLDGWKSTQQFWCEKSYLETVEAGRIDAEYYQPKYDEIIKAIKSYSGGADTLENLCELVGHPSNPPYAEDDNPDKTFIVSQKHLGEYSLSDDYWKDEKSKYTTKEFLEKNRQYILQKNDLVLYTVGGPPHIGKANIVFDTKIKSTIGSFVTLVRAKQEKINPFYLLALFNSSIGSQLTHRFQRGMVQQYIYPKDLVKTIIPILPEHKQLEIQEKIEKSFELRERSKKLLENAKRAVEIAIEQDETTAIQFLNSET